MEDEKGLANYPKELEQSDSQQSDSEEEPGDETDEPRKCWQKRKRQNWCPSEIRFKKMMSFQKNDEILSFFLLLVLLLNKIHNFFSWDYFLFLSPVSNVYHGSIQQTVECACTHPPKGSWKCLPDQCHLPISHSSKICSYQCNDQGGFERIAIPILKTDRCFYFVVYSIFMFVTTNLIQRKNQFVNPL